MVSARVTVVCGRMRRVAIGEGETGRLCVDGRAF